MQVIDCHCHIYPEKIAERAVQNVSDFYDIHRCPQGGTVADLLGGCEHTPINRFIVHSVATKPDQVQSINNFIAEECTKHPELIGFMTLHQDFEDPEAEIERARALGLVGIKLHPDTQRVDMDDPRLMHIYEIAEGKLPIIMHCGDYRYDYSHPRRMKRILHTFPDLVVDAAHFGGWSVFDLGLEYLVDEDCFVDVSSAMAFIGAKRTAEICREYGVERVMFGSDYPLWNPAAEYEFFTNCGFTDDELELMLSQNALRFIGEAEATDSVQQQSSEQPS